MAVSYKSQVKEIFSSDSLVKIDIKKLQVNRSLPFDVYVKEGKIVKKLFNKGMVLPKMYLDILAEQGISDVYIEAADETLVETYILKKPVKESIYDSPVVFSNYSFFKEKHFQIDKRLLIPDTEVNFSIYLLESFSLNKILEASEDNPNRIDESLLSKSGELVIENKDIPLYNEYITSLEKKLSDLPEEDLRTIKANILKETSKIHMTELLKDPRSGDKIKKMEMVVENFIETLSNDPDSIYDLLTLKGYDYYTYTHSINVGTLSIGLGIYIGLKKDRVYKLGIGAMFHDIGKASLPHEILNKQGKLTDHEYNVIKTHVKAGYDILKNHKNIPEESFDAVLQHHEKLSGKGYPYGLKAEEITLFGRITAIADCYDALTTRRPYKPPLTPFFALSIIVREKGDYDPELLKSFIKMLGKIK